MTIQDHAVRTTAEAIERQKRHTLAALELDDHGLEARDPDAPAGTTLDSATLLKGIPR